MILDAHLIRRRREELGLSVRAVAARLGVNGNVVRRIEAGENHPDVNLGHLTKLAETLNVDVATLFAPAAPPDHDGPSDEDTDDTEKGGAGGADDGDVAALGALLHAAGVLTPAAALRDALDWNKARLDRGLAALDVQAATVGLRLNRNPAGFSLTRAVEACPADVLADVIRSHVNRDGLNLTEAAMLRRIVNGEAPREPTNPEAVALGVLGNARLVEHGAAPTATSQAPLVVTDAVRFSLLLDEEPDGPPAASHGP